MQKSIIRVWKEDLIGETEKAYQFINDNLRKAWLPKSQLKISEKIADWGAEGLSLNQPYLEIEIPGWLLASNDEKGFQFDNF
jgi:hypothetical protein